MPDAAPAPAPDQSQRDRIATDLDHTLFVTAGAGSGKTKSLVDRVTALVLDGGVDIGAIAAITFTERAAAELADRVRHAFEAVVDKPGERGPAGAAAAAAALQGLDSAAIGTLHAFAQRLLRENPLEADLPPRIEVLDEIESEVAFEARWSAFAREMFERALDDDSLKEAILVALAGRVTIPHLRDFAVILGDNWDRVAARRSLAHLSPVHPPLDEADVDRLLSDLGEAVAPLASAPAGDTLTNRLQEFSLFLEQLGSATDDAERVEALLEMPKHKVSRCGKADSWGGTAPCDEVRTRMVGVGERLEAWRDSLIAAAVDRLIEELGRFTMDSVEQRRSEGRLEFHDLLVLARRLLTQGPQAADVRRRLQGRYQRLLLDEFQDTDPIQVELAVGIAADPEAPWPVGGTWQELDVPPGRLFFVGDPKQSVYRFRRADIQLYLQAQERFGSDLVTLSANFRTVAPVLDWLNRVFGDLIQPVAGSQPAFQPLIATRAAPDDAGPSVTVLGAQVHPGKPSADAMRRFEAADVAAVVRTAVDDGWLVEDHGAPRPARLSDIAVLLPTRTSLEQLEAALDAAGLPFRAEASSLVYSTREVRDLLAVARAVDDPTDELSIVTALRSAAFGCSDRDLFEYAVTLGGRWDHQHRRLGQSWRPPADADPELPQGRPLPQDHPVVMGLRYLRRLHRERVWLTPSELLDRIIRDRRLFELGVSRGRARDVWRRLRFVADQARAWSAADGGSLREYLAWAAGQGEEDRVTESVLPETDDDAVRILTIHAAKGLEFPITVVSGATIAPQGSRDSVRVAWTVDRLGYRIAGRVQTADFDGLVATEKDLELHERLRLLYVACTRARDHLVVSLHRHERDTGARQANGTILAAATEAVDHWVFPPALEPAVATTSTRVTGTAEGATPQAVAEWTAAMARWRAQHDHSLATSAAVRTWSATALAKAWLARHAPTSVLPATAADAELSEPADPAAAEEGPSAGFVGSAGPAPADDAIAAPRLGESRGHAADLAADPGLEKDPPDLELPPWNKGRYGTAVGRAVHAVLQTVDLAAAVGASAVDDPAQVLTPAALAALDAAVATQAVGEGVAHLQGLVAALAWSALTSQRVAAAVAAPQRWREIYVGTPIGGRPVEGYLDLLYRTPTGYVVVDHKTDSTGSAAGRAALLDRYRGQGATYALAVEAITGEPVEACVFLLLDPTGATEVVLQGDQLRQTMEEVRSLLADDTDQDRLLAGRA